VRSGLRRVAWQEERRTPPVLIIKSLRCAAINDEILAFVNRDAGKEAGPEIRGFGLMEFAGDDFFNLVDIGIAANRYEAMQDIENIIPEYRKEILEFLVADGIIAQTDRHRKNFMFGKDPNTGKWRLIPIDNGLAMLNAGFGKGERHNDDFLYANPIKAIQGYYGNQNGAMGLAQQYIDKIGDAEAKNVIRDFAERMRDRAHFLISSTHEVEGSSRSVLNGFWII